MVAAGAFVLVLLLAVLHGALVVFHLDPGAAGRVERAPDHDQRTRHRDPITDDRTCRRGRTRGVVGHQHNSGVRRPVHCMLFANIIPWMERCQ